MKRQQSQWRWGIHHIDLRRRCNNKSIRIQTSEDYWWFIPSSSTCMHIPVCRLGRLAAAVAAWLCMSWFPYSKHCYKGIHPLSLGFTIMLREAGHDLLLVELWQLMMTVHFLSSLLAFPHLSTRESQCQCTALWVDLSVWFIHAEKPAEPNGCRLIQMSVPGSVLGEGSCQLTFFTTQWFCRNILFLLFLSAEVVAVYLHYWWNMRLNRQTGYLVQAFFAGSRDTGHVTNNLFECCVTGCVVEKK